MAKVTGIGGMLDTPRGFDNIQAPCGDGSKQRSSNLFDRCLFYCMNPTFGGCPLPSGASLMGPNWDS
jgi:hypothetical protein